MRLKPLARLCGIVQHISLKTFSEIKRTAEAILVYFSDEY